MTPINEDDEVDDIAERAMETSLKPSPVLIAVVVALLAILGYIIACQ